MSFIVTVLGCSSALPTSNKYPSAQVLNVHERFFLIDCGEGTQTQLRRCKVHFSKINHIFISHLHGDHFFGLFGLISSFSLLGRKNDLHIYAHSELQTIIFNLWKSIDYRPDFKIVFHHLTYEDKTLIFEDKKVSVYSFPLKHRIKTCGFLVQEKKPLLNIRRDVIDFYQIPIRDIVRVKEGEDFITETGERIENKRLTLPPIQTRSYAYCSDTAYYENIIPHIKGVDVLYHEATFTQDLEKDAREKYHSTAQQAAQIAEKAEVGKLIIGHFSTRYKEDYQKLLTEAQAIFPNTEAADDGKTFVLPEIRREY
jgi:ribonuclease Z